MGMGVRMGLDMGMGMGMGMGMVWCGVRTMSCIGKMVPNNTVTKPRLASSATMRMGVLRSLGTSRVLPEARLELASLRLPRTLRRNESIALSMSSTMDRGAGSN